MDMDSTEAQDLIQLCVYAIIVLPSQTAFLFLNVRHPLTKGEKAIWLCENMQIHIKLLHWSLSLFPYANICAFTVTGDANFNMPSMQI